MTSFDPRTWHTRAMAHVHETNHTDNYAFHERLRSNLNATFTCAAALGAQILVCAAKSIIGPVGKVICYKNAPTFQEWVKTAKKIGYYAIALLQTAYAVLCSFVSPNQSCFNVANQFARGLINDSQIILDVVEIKDNSKAIISDQHSVNSRLAFIKMALKELNKELPPRGEALPNKEYLYELNDKLISIKSIKKWNQQIKELEVDLKSIQWDRMKHFLSKEELMKTEQSIASIAGSASEAAHLIRAASESMDLCLTRMNMSLNEIFTEMRHWYEEAKPRWVDVQKAIVSHFQAYQNFADSLKHIDNSDGIEAAREQTKANAQYFNAMAGHYCKSDNVLMNAYSLLAEPIWSRLHEDTKELANDMFQLRRKAGSIITNIDKIFVCINMKAQQCLDLAGKLNPQTQDASLEKSIFLHHIDVLVQMISMAKTNSELPSFGNDEEGELSDGEVSVTESDGMESDGMESEADASESSNESASSVSDDEDKESDSEGLFQFTYDEKK